MDRGCAKFKRQVCTQHMVLQGGHVSTRYDAESVVRLVFIEGQLMGQSQKDKHLVEANP